MDQLLSSSAWRTLPRNAETAACPVDPGSKPQTAPSQATNSPLKRTTLLARRG